MKYQTEIQIPFPNFSNRDTDDEKQLKIIKNKIENPSEKLKNLKKSTNQMTRKLKKRKIRECLDFYLNENPRRQNFIKLQHHQIIAQVHPGESDNNR